MMFINSIELDISSIDERLIEAMKHIAQDCNRDVIEHGEDRVVFASDRLDGFSAMYDRLNRVCESYGVEFTDLFV